MNLVPYVGGFLAMFAMDIAFARYTLAVGAHRRAAASTFAAVVSLCNALLVLCFVAEPLAMFSVAAGAWCGTFIGTPRPASRSPRPTGTREETPRNR